MRFTLDVRMANTEGALERLLGRLRQRNFVVCSMNAGCTPNFASMNARITVESSRPIELAVKQLSKLFDVDEVQVLNVTEEADVLLAKTARMDFSATRQDHPFALPPVRHHHQGYELGRLN